MLNSQTASNGTKAQVLNFEQVPPSKNHQPVVNLVNNYLEDTTASAVSKTLLSLLRCCISTEEFKQYSVTHIDNTFFEVEELINFISKLQELKEN